MVACGKFFMKTTNNKTPSKDLSDDINYEYQMLDGEKTRSGYFYIALLIITLIIAVIMIFYFLKIQLF